MRLPAVSGSLSRLALRSLGAACGCAARSWAMVLERDLPGATLRTEIRSR